MEFATQTKFEAFVAFYHENRDRFELSQRKRWDEMIANLDAPEKFYWMKERAGSYDAMTIGWDTNSGRHKYEFPLYEIHYHKWTGKAALNHMTHLSGKLEELNPELGNAMVWLIEYNRDVDDLVVWYNLDIGTGKLLMFKAIHAKGLMQVMAKLEE